MSFFTKPMKLLTAVVLQSCTDAVSKAMLNCGVVDFIELRNAGYETLKARVQTDDPDKKQLDIISRKMMAVFAQAGRHVPDNGKFDASKVPPLDEHECLILLDSLSTKIQNAREKQKTATQKQQLFEEMKSYLEENQEYLDIRVGSFLGDNKDFDISPRFPGLAVLSIPGGQDKQVIVSFRRDGNKINPKLDSLQWEETDNAEAQKKAPERAKKALEEKLSLIQTEVDSCVEDISKVVGEEGEQLDSYYKSLLVQRLCLKIQSFFSHTKNTAIFSGWVPLDRCSDVEEAIRNATDNQCIIDWAEASEATGVPVPVELSGPELMKPFERIVKNYAIPQYGTVNPTPFVMAAYLSMFALMFADVGQGLVILLLGLLIKNSYKKNPLKKQGLITSNLSELMVYLGIASMIGGALFGSYFGYSLLPALWFNYHAVVMGSGDLSGSVITSIYQILGITIRFGFIIIVLGLIINWINLAGKKQWVKMTLDKNGIVGGTIYITGFFVVKSYVQSGYKSFPDSSLWKIILGICVVALLFKKPLECILEHKKISFDFMDWIIDLLETFSGYLSNTLSFMRVAGLGIAHVGLMSAFEQMAEMFSSPIAAILVMAAGNAMCIAIEGLSAGIQALRLNYYEFFNKFFTGKGIAYRPVNLKS